jgi:hypothetical protein
MSGFIRTVELVNECLSIGYRLVCLWTHVWSYDYGVAVNRTKKELLLVDERRTESSALLLRSSGHIQFSWTIVEDLSERYSRGNSLDSDDSFQTPGGLFPEFVSFCRSMSSLLTPSGSRKRVFTLTIRKARLLRNPSLI